MSLNSNKAASRERWSQWPLEHRIRVCEPLIMKWSRTVTFWLCLCFVLGKFPLASKYFKDELGEEFIGAHSIRQRRYGFYSFDRGGAAALFLCASNTSGRINIKCTHKSPHGYSTLICMAHCWYSLPPSSSACVPDSIFGGSIFPSSASMCNACSVFSSIALDHLEFLPELPFAPCVTDFRLNRLCFSPCYVSYETALYWSRTAKSWRRLHHDRQRRESRCRLGAVLYGQRSRR